MLCFCFFLSSGSIAPTIYEADQVTTASSNYLQPDNLKAFAGWWSFFTDVTGSFGIIPGPNQITLPTFFSHHGGGGAFVVAPNPTFGTIIGSIRVKVGGFYMISMNINLQCANTVPGSSWAAGSSYFEVSEDTSFPRNRYGEQRWLAVYDPDTVGWTTVTPYVIAYLNAGSNVYPIVNFEQGVSTSCTLYTAGSDGINTSMFEIHPLLVTG